MGEKSKVYRQVGNFLQREWLILKQFLPSRIGVRYRVEKRDDLTLVHQRNFALMCGEDAWQPLLKRLVILSDFAFIHDCCLPTRRTNLNTILPYLLTVRKGGTVHPDSVSNSAVRAGIADSIVPAFWTRDAEALASSDASASCYGAPENIWILAVVVAELEFRKVERQVFLAHMMVSSDHTALEQAPKVIDVRRVDFAAYVFASRMVYRVVLVTAGAQISVAGMLVGSDQVYLIAHGLTHEAIERSDVGVFNHLADHVTLAADSADDRSFIAAESALAAFLAQ